MSKARLSCSPSRGPPQRNSPARQSPVKASGSDGELMRVLRERDALQGMLDKYERHLSEIQANVKVLTADRDTTSLHYQQAQEEIAALRREVLQSKSPRSAKGSVTVQGILGRVEAQRDEATADLHRMSTERDSLRERLKISQETAISERARLEQRVEDLQNAILTLEQDRGEQRNRLALMREAMRGLEEEVHGLGRKMSAAEEELGRSRKECVALRLSNTQVESSLTDSQRRLTSRIRELQNSQQRSQLLEENNNSLRSQLSGLREEVGGLQANIAELDQRRDTLQDQLEKKSQLLDHAHSQLDGNDKLIGSLRLRVEELETCTERLREAQSGHGRELEVLRKRLGEAGEELGAVAMVKEVTARENAQLRDALEESRVDNQALQRRADDLQRTLQEHESLISTKEQECREQQEVGRRACAEVRLKLRSSDTERRRLTETVASLEASLQETQGQLSQLSRSLLQTQDQLEKTRKLCIKLDTRKETMQQELQAYRSEVELLRKQLASERLSSQERHAHIQLLRDQLAVSDSKASGQSREVAQLKKRSAQLQMDLETTMSQLSTERMERERAVRELRGQGLGLPSPPPCQGLGLPSPPPRRSTGPRGSRSPERSYRPPGSGPSPERSFRDLYD